MSGHQHGARARVSVAGLGLAVALLAAPLVPSFSGSLTDGCPLPREHTHVGGWTRSVQCHEPSADGVRGPARLLFGERLDLNRADARALEVLPGIGPVRAAAIVRARNERPFAAPEDLTRVRGIGPHTFARVADWITVLP